MMNTKSGILVLLTAAFALLWTGIGFTQPAQEIIAVVNDSTITRSDLMWEEAHLMQEMRLRKTPLPGEQLPQLRAELLDNLIDRELLYQQAQEKNIQIRDRWVERALTEFKAHAGSDAAYAAFLEKSGMSEDQLREQLGKGLIVQRLLRREVARSIKVSEAEMQTFYRNNPEFFFRKEQIRLRHILIKVDGNALSTQRGEALLKIQEIQSKLQAGANFGALALDYSEDASRDRGGDIGVVERTLLVPAFAEAAFALQPGEISDIVETRFGYHLIQLVDRIPSSTMAYRNVRTKIERTLRRNKEKAAAEKYLGRLRARSTIKKMLAIGGQ
jgi:peptidyl-prolyl cis-trans isomerase C